MVILVESTPMRRLRVAPAFIFAGFFVAQLLCGQARTALVQFSELTPLPLSQQLSAMREPLPVETIVDAALEFSGASEAGASAAKDRLEALLLKFRGEVSDVTDQAALAERALTFLHKSLFVSYSVQQTRVDTALENGVYNCVSSAVLYLVLARSVGLSVGAVRTTDHAFCTVLVNGQQVDVETTNPYGFNPGARKEFTDSFGKTTGFAYVPPANYRDRRSIGEKELLSLILYNRVAEYVDGRALRDALQPAVSAFALMGNDDTRRTMTDVFTAYLGSLGERRDFLLALEFADAVKGSFGGIVNLDQARADLYHNWVVTLVDAQALSDAAALLAQPAARAALDSEDWMALSVEIVQRQAHAQNDTAGAMAAAGVVADALRRLGRQPALLQAYEVYVHNAFATLYNAKRPVDAKAVVDQGLSVYPESRMLLQDLDLARKALHGSRS
jgi:hypothetical protein